jgi:Cof subfamily protein (haloacid dehalogenase superfamily)
MRREAMPTSLPNTVRSPKYIIAIDVDGTLLNDHHEISPLTRATIQKAQEKGALIVLASGRGPHNGLPVMDDLGIQGWMITHNGALTVDSQTKEVVSRFSVPKESVMPAVEYARQHGIHFDVCNDFDQFVESLVPAAADMYEKFGIAAQTMSCYEDWNEVLVKFTLFGTKEQLNQCELDLAPRFTELNFVRSGETFIDIFSREASKGKALQDISEKLKVPREQIVAFGNYYNDIAMMDYAGRGIAMGNSPMDVKQAADEVAPTNNEDGVAIVLQRMLGIAAAP